MGGDTLPHKTLPKVAPRWLSQSLAYNLTRVINIVGTKPLMAPIVAETEPARASSPTSLEGCFYTAKTRSRLSFGVGAGSLLHSHE